MKTSYKSLRLVIPLLFFIFGISISYSQSGDLMPGIDRWEVKTNAPNLESSPKFIPLKKLIQLPLLAPEYGSNDYPSSLIPVEVDKNLTEGQIIYTAGYLHLVALERDSKYHRDGDYHIQITLHPEWTDSCFIVEIPYEDFVTNAKLQKACEQYRKYIRDNLLEGKEPSESGKPVPENGVYVKVTGQLFYDAIHATQMRNPDVSKRRYRGKNGGKDKPMHSYTAWEIHPVTSIEIISDANEITGLEAGDNDSEAGSTINKSIPPSNKTSNIMESTPFNTLCIILLGAILGMVGQGLRVIVGIKKLQEVISSTGEKDLFQSKQLILSLLIAFAIGAIAGVLAAVGSTEIVFTRTVIFSFIAAGYAGTDFIEGFMRKNPNVTKAGNGG